MKRCWTLGTTIFCVALLALPALAKEKKEVVERYEATAMSVERGRASMMEIGIFAWSTDEDRTALINTFEQGGNEALYKALSENDEMAFVSLPGTLGYQMRYAYQGQSSDGKRVITLATDRPILMGEVMGGSQTQDDNVSLVVLMLDPETGEGTGEMIVGAQFGVDKKTGQLEIETIARDPIKFTTVKPMKVKHKK